MTPEEKAIEEAALQFAKEHRARLARGVADTKVFPSEVSPLTVFMAGSPGAGKTEISKAMVDVLEQGTVSVEAKKILRIDPDDFRCLIPGYAGSNSYLYQRGVTRILERVLDRVFEKRISFLLDGTLANIDVAKRNINRVLANQRIAQVIYVYQEPSLAWQFVQAREITEGRNIPLEVFVLQYLAARRNVIELRKCYDERFFVDLIIKNTDGTASFFEGDVSAERIDALIPQTYDQSELVELLTGVHNHERG
ncbi:zeta toxin family protein [Pseudomonas nunensis]|uniref:zeta toxin family protein n=1 Tax=Pseudomonas nunensis TaxID=2961896 RepID=UPI0006B563A1|nr:zeta toxin family protein [Pseudomonas nunensis]KOX98978.1 Zeta toxin [Pseudomonas nunensis]